MKIQERTGAAHGRGSSAPAQGVGERLPSAPRERKPALAALAVLLILVGALGATVLVLRAGDRIEVVKITQDVTAGKKIPDSAMESVLVAEDSGIDYVKWDQRDAIAKYRATKDIVAGSLLVGPMLTEDSKGLPDGKVLVGLSLKAGQYPKDLAQGDTVTAFRVSDADNKGGSNGSAGSSGASGGSGGGADTMLAPTARVQDVGDGNSGDIGSTDLPVSLLVDKSQAATLVQAAAAGEVAIVKVPAAGE
ncbi:hypothetical protein [Streptomyces sp. XD-27]|uniref:hypothetical protein n=1 Tax=Streptomyces sp. XD-27 TaxID=3062779 RepID=UPI0026F43B46|nr:hypothetical protein [Streptomyces sp. XD-27]WKX70961.1 hypothetical protein Q3Y56_14530 [Streptomyces sp. XD-27]